MRNKGGVKQYQKLLDLLKSGKEVSVEEIQTTMGAAGLAVYRIPAYLWDCNHYAGAEIESIKSGRKVTAYKLKNPEKFKDFVLGSTATVTVAKAAAAKKAAPKKVAPKAKAKPAVKATKVKPATKKAGAPTVSAKDAEALLTKEAVKVGKKSLPTAKAPKEVKVTKVAEGVSGISVDPDYDMMPDIPSFMDRNTGLVITDEV